MFRTSRCLALATLLLLACFSAGCIEEKTAENSINYAFSWWVPALLFLGGIAMVPVGWITRQTRFGWAFLIGGPAVLLVLAPGTLTDRVTVDAEQFTLHTGFWFAPTHFEVRFDDVERIEITSETRRGRRGRKKTSYFLDCYRKSGGMDHVPIGTLMEEAAGAVLAVAQERGIPLNDLTGEN